MSSTLTIGIVEDELIVAEDMRDLLKSIGYHVSFLAMSYHETMAMLAKSEVDLLLIDIRIKGDQSGIELAKLVRQQFNLPFIFVTSNGDRATIDEAKQTHPYGYLLKPFDKDDLYASIEVAMGNFQLQQSNTLAEGSDYIIKDSLFIRDKHYLVKVPFHDILYLRADGNYTMLFTEKRKIVSRNTLKDFEACLPGSRFIRIHKSYIVHVSAITGISAQSLLLGEHEIPLGRNYQDMILPRINKIG
jgi:DNA-binding LytR/AlgR family response regulator